MVRRSIEANRWRVEAVELGREAAKRGDFAEAERLFLHAGASWCKDDLVAIYIRQERWREAIALIDPRPVGQDPGAVNASLAVCYYALGDRRAGDALAPKHIAIAGAYATWERDEKGNHDETPHHVPLDSSRRLEAAAWHAIASNEGSSWYGVHCARRAALIAPECAAFVFSFANKQDNCGYFTGAAKWYRRALPLARGTLVEDLEIMYIPQADAKARDHIARPDTYPDRGEYTE